MKHLARKTCLSLGVVALSVAATAGSAAASTSAHTPNWHPVLTLKNAATPTHFAAFDAVAATGKTRGWAFLTTGKTTYAYQRTGAATWKRTLFPAAGGQVTVAAGVNDGPVFAGYLDGKKTELYKWTGKNWQLLFTVPGEITGMSALSADDLWIFGSAEGVAHWNGHGRVELVNSVQGGYALSDSDVWAFNGQRVLHYNGKTWTSADVKKLLPPVDGNSIPHDTPYVTGIVALSPTDVYATGDGVEYPHGGPMALLHYNGHAWSRVLLAGNSTTPLEQELVPDGKGGLWIPGGDGAGNPALFHYTAAGKLTRAQGPFGTTYVFPAASVMSRIPGTAEILAAGVGYSQTSDKQSPTIVEYS